VISLDEARKSAQAERERAEAQLQQLSDLEAENALLRRRFQTFESDKDKDKKQLVLLKEQLQAVRGVSSPLNVKEKSLWLQMFIYDGPNVLRHGTSEV
jgi:hypothetical protein